MPDMSPAEFEAKADIVERGVVVPIDVDESGEILDGHHRYRAWAELHKNEPPPTIVRDGLSEAEKRAFARKNNILEKCRRQWRMRLPSKDFLTGWSAFLDKNRDRSLDNVVQELKHLQERFEQERANKRRRGRRAAP